mgnify:CR=1 FL=1
MKKAPFNIGDTVICVYHHGNDYLEKNHLYQIVDCYEVLGMWYVIVDSKVNELYKDYLPKNTITFDCTETNKTLIGASDLFKELIKRKIKIKKTIKFRI